MAVPLELVFVFLAQPQLAHLAALMNAISSSVLAAA